MKEGKKTKTKAVKPKKAIAKSDKAVEGEIVEVLKLRPKQELFCLLYMVHRGNGVKAYSEAYGRPILSKLDYQVCGSGAYENLKKPQIIQYISNLKKKADISAEDLMNELKFVAHQDNDLKSKVAALRLFFDIEGKTSKDDDVRSIHLTQNNFYGPTVVAEATKALLKDIRGNGGNKKT